jgi:hypothetical protein
MMPSSSYPACRLPGLVASTATPVIRPNPNDVLLGRGKPFQNWAGNQNMLNLIDSYRKRYHEAERAYKHRIIEDVLRTIRGSGGRFLGT